MAKGKIYDNSVMTAELRGKIIEYLNANLSESRIQHTKNVVKTGKRLAMRFDHARKRVELAAICHDMMRDADLGVLNALMREAGMPEHYIDNKNLAHGKAAAMVMEREFGITDSEILSAVTYHTTGRPGMTDLEKIVYLADAIEPARTYAAVEDIREAAKKNLTRACLLSIEDTIEYVTAKNNYLEPITLETRDALIQELNEKGGQE